MIALHLSIKCLIILKINFHMVHPRKYYTMIILNTIIAYAADNHILSRHRMFGSPIVIINHFYWISVATDEGNVRRC